MMQLQRYQAAAGAPVPSFRYFSFNSWTSLGREHVAVWTRPNEAWLIELKPLCPELDFAQRIAFRSHNHQLRQPHIFHHPRNRTHVPRSSRFHEYNTSIPQVHTL